MNKYSLLLLSVICFLTGITVAAQKPIVNGFYVSHNGDTVRGSFPEYAQWSKNPSSVKFISADGATHILTPNNTKSFVVEGFDEFHSFSGTRLLNPIEDNVLLKQSNAVLPEDEYQPIESFLRLVSRTTAAELFIFNDENRHNLYIRLKGDTLTELKYKKAFDLNKIVELPVFRQQLSNLFADAIAKRNATARLETITYSETDLKRLLEDLYPPLKINSRAGEKNSFVLSAGVSYNFLRVSGSGNNFNTVPTRYSNNISPLLAIGFYQPLDRNFGRYFLYPQFKLFTFRTSGKITDNQFITSTTYKAQFVAGVEINAGANFINKADFKWYVSAGMGMLFINGGRETRQLTYKSNGSLYAYRETRLPASSISILAGTGVTYKKRYVVSFNYMLPATLANYLEYSPRLSTFQLQVGYRLRMME